MKILTVLPINDKDIDGALAVVRMAFEYFRSITHTVDKTPTDSLALLDYLGRYRPTRTCPPGPKSRTQTSEKQVGLFAPLTPDRRHVRRASQQNQFRLRGLIKRKDDSQKIPTHIQISALLKRFHRLAENLP